MRFEGLDLNLLVALEVLLECRSTTETARRLHLSQPTISAALSRLRLYFNDELLMNVGREMVPTAMGEELAPAITELLNVARFRIIQAEGFDPATSHRRFRILTSDYTYDVLLADTLAIAARQAPHVTFELLQTGPEGARLFQKGEVDVMITVPNYVLPDHPSLSLFSDEDAVICWSEGKYAAGIDQEQFLMADCAIAVFGEERRPTISDLHFRKHNIALNCQVEVSSFSALPGAVCGTDRIAVMHSRHARFFQRAYPLACHPLPVSGTEVREIAQWHTLRRKDQGIRWLLDLLQVQARTGPSADSDTPLGTSQ
ncbi:MAG: LysR family transcriptional regulator [Sphingomonadaceae bacterium]